MAKDTRVQKALSEWGVSSRRKAEEMILKGLVKVNGRPCKLGDKIDLRKDIVTVDGKQVQGERNKEKIYLMMHKPRGYVTTLKDELGRKSVMDLLKIKERVYPIGRLDRNSEGLLLFTNDGDFSNMCMHPAKHITKTYRVTVRPDISDEQLVQLSEGIYIDGRKTAPAVVRVLTKEQGRVVLEIILREGRNRQIRKMCEAVHLEVARLKRVAFGPVKLGMLQPGEVRELTKQELSAIRNAAGKDAEDENKND